MGPFEVQWEQAELSVNAENAPLAQILYEIASKTALQVEGAETLQQRVSCTSCGFLLLKINY